MTRPARIIFVPGMKPKPPEELYRQVIRRCLQVGLERVGPDAARVFRDDPSCLALIAWTYLFYGEHRDINLDRAGIERVIEQPEPLARDIAEIESLARRKSRVFLAVGEAAPLFYRLFAKPSMRLTIAEALRYLRDRRGVATAIRNLLRKALVDAWSAGERVLLIGHSLGSVIAYDTLWELSRGERRESGRVDLFMSLGSPLASRLILRGLQGRRRKGRERYPHNIIRWQNFSARGELTALHPRLEPFFGEMVKSGLLESLQDFNGFYNHYRGPEGLDVHTSYGYLLTRPVSESIAAWLRVDPADRTGQVRTSLTAGV